MPLAGMRISSKDTAKGEFGKDRDKGSGFSLEQMLLEQMLLFVRSVAATMELRDMQQRKHEAWYAEHTFVRCLLPQTEENLEECARSVQSEPWGTETDRPLKMPRLSK